ncbi:MAG TPA: hypothetical protein VFH24_01105 [Gemmatimonadales bacterium]|nr:hypothetical protein [Gemmatimonadales bacterium]
MKYFLMLAAAASLAACHQRSEDEVGAAPDQGDTTAVVADTTAMPTDTTMGQTETDTSFVGQDTTTMTEPTPGDSALVDEQVPDTTTGATPTDTTTGATPADTSTAGYTDTTSTTGQDTSGMAAPADSASQ